MFLKLSVMLLYPPLLVSLAVSLCSGHVIVKCNGQAAQVKRHCEQKIIEYQPPTFGR